MKKFNVALLGFYNDSGHIMLNRRLDASEEMWELIGGSIEEGETVIEAIVREVQEELQYQIDIKKDKLRLIDEFKLETDRFSAEVHYFTARFPGFDTFADSNEVRVSDLKMFSTEEALSLTLLPITRNILER